jgi:hypothetical protein
VWAYAAGAHEDIKAVVYDFCESRAGANAKANQIRPIAIGRNNCMLAGSLRAGQRAAAVMSLMQSVTLNSHDPHVYFKDVLTRLALPLVFMVITFLHGCEGFAVFLP